MSEEIKSSAREIAVEFVKIGWAAVAALGRIADGIEGVRKDRANQSEERRVLSQKRAAAARVGMANRKRNEDGTLAATSKSQQKPASAGEVDGPANDQQTTSKPQQKASKTPAKSLQVWEAYRKAYALRYRVEPPRNQMVNSQLCKLIDHLGEPDAVLVAEFYLTSNDSFYLHAAHSVGLLVRDYQKLFKEAKTGRRTTRHEAQKQDTNSALDEAFAKVRQGGGASI